MALGNAPNRIGQVPVQGTRDACIMRVHPALQAPTARGPKSRSHFKYVKLASMLPTAGTKCAREPEGNDAIVKVQLDELLDCVCL